MKRACMIAAPTSGSGKTTIARGLMALLMQKGYKVQPFKCGPDYIDTKFHEAVCGRPSINLDTFMASREHVRELFARDNADDKAKADFADLMDSLYTDLRARKIKFSDYLGKMDEFIRSRIDKNYKAGEHDMSGLSNRDANGYDDAARTDEVMATETLFGEALTDELWDSINSATVCRAV